MRCPRTRARLVRRREWLVRNIISRAALSGYPVPAGWGIADPRAAAHAGDCRDSASSCAETGLFLDGSDHFQAFVASQNSGVWGTAIQVPGLAALNKGGDADARSVSCAPSGPCTAWVLLRRQLRSPPGVRGHPGRITPWTRALHTARGPRPNAAARQQLLSSDNDTDRISSSTGTRRPARPGQDAHQPGRKRPARPDLPRVLQGTKHQWAR